MISMSADSKRIDIKKGVLTFSKQFSPGQIYNLQVRFCMQIKQQGKPDDFSCGLASLMILIGVSVGSVVVLISRQGNSLTFNGFDVLERGHWYLIFTSVIGLYSWRDLLFFVGSVLYLMIKLPRFEKKVTTLYTFYHFLKVNFLIQVFLLLHYHSKMRINQPVISGIYCYTLYLYLHECFLKPGQTREFLCSTLWMPNWLRGFFISFIVVFWAPSLQGCLSVILYWVLRGILIFLCYVLGLAAGKMHFEMVEGLLLKKYWAQGSLFQQFLAKIQKLIGAQKIPRFVTVAMIKQREEIPSQSPERRNELVEEFIQKPLEDVQNTGHHQSLKKQTTLKQLNLSQLKT